MQHRLLPWAPEKYHGKENSRPYFEGWYFKLSSPEDDFSLAVIPGVSMGQDEKDDHSFIQVLFGNNSHYVKFPRDKFKCKKDEKGLPILPGTVFSSLYTCMVYIMIFSGLITGISMVYSFLAYHGTRPVNVTSFTALFIVLQVIFILFAPGLYRMFHYRM